MSLQQLRRSSAERRVSEPLKASFSIQGKQIGSGHPCYLIAEAGSNHGGSLDRAFKMIEVAASAGVDAVKFQLFDASKLYPPASGKSAYLQLDRPIFDVIKDLELPRSWLPELDRCCRTNGVHLLVSAFDEGATDFLEPFVPAFKVASYEMTHWPLVAHTLAKGKPLLISTGAANMSEVEDLMDRLEDSSAREVALLQCTAAYPAPLASINAQVIRTFKERFGVPVGLSDHSIETSSAPLAAVALGADLIEKHFTLDRGAPGPDHRFALEPKELHRLVAQVREVEEASGDGQKVVHPVEEELRNFARRSIFVTRDLAAGHTLQEEDLVVLRNGEYLAGFEPKGFDSILGRQVASPIAAFTPLRPQHLA